MLASILARFTRTKALTGFGHDCVTRVTTRPSLNLAGLCLVALLTLMVGCNRDSNSQTTQQQAKSDTGLTSVSNEAASRTSRLSQYRSKLSDYGLFQEPMGKLQPAEGVIEYQLNTPLFTDYAQKQRLIKLPAGTAIDYTPHGPLDFPVGTIIAKTFYYAHDLQPDQIEGQGQRQLIETRILENRGGEVGWVGIPYVWNEDQTDAELAIAGDAIDVSWIHTDGTVRKNVHAVPNLNDCKRCHTNLVMEPVGPKANNLNLRLDGRNKNLTRAAPVNQLVAWQDMGWLRGLPDLDSVPRLVKWDDPSESIHDRARAYLDVNCAHCHNEQGPARNSGLHLNVEEQQAYRLGKFKTPVAAGKGTGGRMYGIVPGKPDESIMEYRMRTTKPGEIMPEFGKSLVHEEGLALIREWIEQME